MIGRRSTWDKQSRQGNIRTKRKDQPQGASRGLRYGLFGDHGQLVRGRSAEQFAITYKYLPPR